VIAKPGDLALALVAVRAFSTGFSLQLALRLHPDAEFDSRRFLMQLHGGDGLHFGIEFADGRKATNLGRPPLEHVPEIHLSSRGYGGGDGSYDLQFWVYPLPPPGSILLAAAWPGRFAETRHELDAAPILEAAAHSEQLWPDERPVGGPGSGPASITPASFPRPDAGRPAPGP